MLTSSAKQKGRKLQQTVCKLIVAAFPHLTSRDAISRSSGANGTDVILSAAAYGVFPYAVECKNRQDLKSLYGHYDQAGAQGDGEPLLVLKMNNRDALVVISAEHFFKMVSKKLCQCQKPA